MQAANFRYFVLIATLLAGAGLYAVLGEPNAAGVPHWPEDESLYAIDSWAAGPPSVDRGSNSGERIDLVTRVFHKPNGASATMTIVTNQAPKLYGAGAEVPFLGNGYTVEPAPPDIAALEADGVKALTAQRGSERWLVMYAYGERRGLLGNGPAAWTLAFMDSLTGRPNDYYKLYLAARTDRLDYSSSQEVASLARTLFARIAAWYAA